MPCWKRSDPYSLRTDPNEETGTWSDRASASAMSGLRSTGAWFVLNCRGTGERVTDEDAVLLTPFRRYRKYKQFPLDIVLHVVVLALVICQAALLSSEYLTYSRNTAITIQSTFLADELKGGIFTVPDAVSFMQDTVDKYYLFPAISLARYASFLVPVGNHDDFNSTSAEETTLYDEQQWAAGGVTPELARKEWEAAKARQGYPSSRLDGESDVEIMKWARQPIIMRVTKYKDLYGRFWKLNCPDNVTELINHYTDHNSTYIYNDDAKKDSPQQKAQPDMYGRREQDYSSYFSDTIWLTYSDFTFVDVDDEVDAYEIDGDFGLEETTYPLTLTSPLGPFTTDLASCELQELFYSVTQVKFSFTYQSVNIGTLAILPYQWDVEVILDFVGGLADPSIDIRTKVISVDGISANDITNLINFVLLVCALLSAGLSILSIGYSVKVYLRTRRRYMYLQRAAMPGDEYPSWASIPLRVHPSFFSLWEIFNVLGCAAVCSSCIASYLEEYTDSTSSSMFLVTFGVASFLTFVNMTKYFEYFPLLYLHVETLRHAAVYVMTYCVSVLPLYAGFVVFGVLNFGPYSEKFTNVGKTIISLFSLLNGDDIYPTFTEIEDNQYPHPWVSRAYIIIFVTTFITSVLNVFIFIIEDSYRVAKHHNLYKDQEHMPRHLLVDGMAVPVVSSGREVLQVIFRNLYTWSERIEANPGIFDAVPDNGLEELQEVCLQVPENPSSQPAIAPFASHLQDEALLDRAAQVSKEDRERRKRRRPRSVSTQLPTVTSMDVAALDLSSSSGAVPKTRRPSASDEIRMTASPSVTSDESDAEESSGLLGKSESGNFLDVASAARMRRKERKVERPEGTLSLSVPSLGSESLPPADASARPPLDSSARSTAATAPQDSASLLSMLQTELVAQKAAFEHRFRIQEQELQKIRLEHHKALANILHLCQALEPMLPPSAHVPTTVVDEDEEPQS